MAISFNVGVNWCHDFPKLARESGFYFNIHRPKIRIDWDRISSINIDHVIRERDFTTIDENIKNVINYCLEWEHDVNILEPNFVKLFRIAQLAVEYLLYCKQYLDHSVVILKDELKMKIEENCKLKKELAKCEDIIKQLKEKVKERSKFIEAKIGDSQGEIHKCPHCPKTFVSAAFVRAHAARRHPQTDTFSTSTPVHEHYRAETEKLHNEIKSLKERLNQTERIINNESFKLPDDVVSNDNKVEGNGVSDKKRSIHTHQQFHVYEEEINNLKDVLFNEIRNLKHRDTNLLNLNEFTSITDVKALIDRQEKEIQRLRNELSERLTPDVESMRAKLYTQEDYWQKKLEKIEYQHHMDIERLSSELKSTQDAAEQIKTEYKNKVNDLEEKSLNQSQILIQQNEQLISLSNNIHYSQMHAHCNGSMGHIETKCHEHNEADVFSNTNIPKVTARNNKNASIETNDVKQSLNKNRNTIMVTTKRKLSLPEDINIQAVRETPSKREQYEYLDNRKQHQIPVDEVTEEISSASDDIDLDSKLHFKKQADSKHVVKQQEIAIEQSRDYSQNYKRTLNTRGMELTGNTTVMDDDTSSKTLTESSTSESLSPSYLDSLEESDSVGKYPVKSGKNERSLESRTRLNKDEVKEDLQAAFHKKLKDLGLDPEWEGIPAATYLQKMEIVRHHQNINSKKLHKYDHIRTKVLKDVLRRISTKQIKEDMGPRWHSIKATTHSLPANRNQHDQHESKRFSPVLALGKRGTDSVKSTTRALPTGNKRSLDKVKDLNGATEQNVIRNDIMIVSPKSVLKPSTGSMGSLVKKKVLFDLNDKKCTANVTDATSASVDELFTNKDRSNVTDESISSITDERKSVLNKEKSMSTGNIVLKTSQADKILEISRKIENKLNVSQWKPAGAIETVFLTQHIQSKQPSYKENQQLESVTAVSIASDTFAEENSQRNEPENNQLSTSFLKHKKVIDNISSTDQASLNDSDLEADINEILQLT